MENLAVVNFNLDEILINYLNPIEKIVGYGMDGLVDSDEALEISHSMLKALGRELWILHRATVTPSKRFPR